jgi:hypothetical protein
MTTLSAITSSMRPAVAEAKQFGSRKMKGFDPYFSEWSTG